MPSEGGYRYRSEDRESARADAIGPANPSVVLTAVREDIRQTLRTGWVDPALEAAASNAVFFTAAWSAVRPNVGKSFISLARALRAEAADSAARLWEVPDVRKRLELELSEEELHRVEESARAAHLAMAKTQVVVHALYRTLRRERLPGTGREESPIRRGVPEWQRWMTFQPASESARLVLDEAVDQFGLPAQPTPLRLLARWPAALSALWRDLRPAWGTKEWTTAAGRLRRIVLAGMSTLPHPVALQWAALRARGFGEEDRLRLLETMAGHDAAMPSQTLAAAFAWQALGAPDVGSEG